LAGHFFGMGGGMSEDQVRLDAGIAEQASAESNSAAPLVAAARIGVIKQSCFAHGRIEDGLYFEAERFCVN